MFQNLARRENDHDIFVDEHNKNRNNEGKFPTSFGVSQLEKF